LRGCRFVVCLLLLVLTACTIPRRPAPSQLFDAAAPPGFPASIRYLNFDRRRLADAASLTQRLRHSSADGNIKILALSGGGAVGAFGAGALIGLGRVGQRPEFQVVTGVSAGALLAPFAFLGPDWDSQLSDAFSGYSTTHLLRARGLAILFHPGWFRAEPLIAIVDRFVTDAMVQAIAREGLRGRILDVATTDLDSEETVIWDLTRIAEVGGEPARKLIRDVLVASASIPGLFPPVMIHVQNGDMKYDEMHVDGSATTPFFVAPEAAFLVSLDPALLQGGSIYVLVNGQLATLPQTTRMRTIRILSRTFSATLRHNSRTEMIASAEFASHYSMSLRFTSLPIEYPHSDPLDFRESTMQALFHYGMECAEQGRLWMALEQALDRSEEVAREPPAKLLQRTLTPSCPIDIPGTAKPPPAKSP
jgi:hypothetical protein